MQGFRGIKSRNSASLAVHHFTGVWALIRHRVGPDVGGQLSDLAEAVPG